MASACSASSEALDDLVGGVLLSFGLADDPENLVERVEDLLEAFEDVDALLERLQLVLEAFGHYFETEVQEVPEDLVQIHPLRPPDLDVALGRFETGQIHDEAGLQHRVLEQVGHHHLLVGILLEFEKDPDVVGGNVLDVEKRRQLAARRDLADLLDQRGLVDGVGNAGDVERLRVLRCGPSSHVPRRRIAPEPVL